MKLPFVRFVRHVSNERAYNSSNYVSMMKNNAEALKSAKWIKERCSHNEVGLTVNDVYRTDGVLASGNVGWKTKPTYTIWLDDRADVFAQCADADISTNKFCGYAGCVAYRFTLPDTNPSAIKSFSLGFLRDRFLRAGIRASVCFSNDDTPSNEWDRFISPTLTVSRSPEELGFSSDSVYIGKVLQISSTRMFALFVDNERIFSKSWGYLPGQIIDFDYEKKDGSIIPVRVTCSAGFQCIVTGRYEDSREDIGVESWGLLGQPNVNELQYSRDKHCVVSYSDSMTSGMGTYRYLYVYVTLEDPDAHWKISSIKTDEEGVTTTKYRGCRIEGSAILATTLCDFSFDNPESSVSDASSFINGDFSFYSLRNDLISAGKSSISPDFYRVNRLAGFIIPKGKMNLIANVFNRFLANMRTRMLNGGSGSDVSAKNNSNKYIEGYCDSNGDEFGNPNSFIRIEGMEVFGNWPDSGTVSNRILFLSRRCNGYNNKESQTALIRDASGSKGYPAMAGYDQVVFGYATVKVPKGKSQYTSITIEAADLNVRHSIVDISFNIWKSRSASCLGMYSNAAIASLAKNVEMFTGSVEHISSSSTVNIGCGSGNVEVINVTASATLMATVKVTDRLSVPVSCTGMDFSPGDVIIIAPKVDGFNNISDSWDGTSYFMSAFPDSIKNAKPNISQGVKISVKFS